MRTGNSHNTRCKANGTAPTASLLLYLAAFAGSLLVQSSDAADAPVKVPAAYQEIERQWSAFTRPDLLKAAQAGNPTAQFYYGITEWKAAGAEFDKAYDQWQAPNQSLPSNPDRNSRTNWT